MQETFFNPTHLIKTLEIYDEQFDNWSQNKRRLFWCQVVGFTQRFAPAPLAQAKVQGLYNIVVKNQSLVRSFKYQYDSGSYFPLVEAAGVGFDFGIGRGAVPATSVRRGFVTILLKTLEQIRQSYLDLSNACGLPESPLRTMTA